MEITQEQIEKYEADKKAFDAHMESIKPDMEKYGFEYGGLEHEGGWAIEGGEDAYYKALSEWQMAKSCDAPNAPGYFRANND